MVKESDDVNPDTESAALPWLQGASENPQSRDNLGGGYLRLPLI